LLLLCNALQGQDTIKQHKGNGLFLVESGLAVTSLAGLSVAWYNTETEPFHAFNDAREWLLLDKIGHATTAYQLVRVNSQILQWGGMAEIKALKRSAVLAFGYLTIIEVFDGFSPGYGASFSDLGTNVLGVGVGYLQHRMGLMDHFTLKFAVKKTK